MEAIKDIWVVDKTYSPPKNSNIVRKEINTRTNEERFLTERLVPVKDEPSGSFWDNMADSVYLSNNPLMWLCAMVAYFIHFIVPATLWLCYAQDRELFGTPLFFISATISTLLLVYGEFTKKRYYIIPLYTWIIILTLAFISFYLFAYTPIKLLLN